MEKDFDELPEYYAEEYKDEIEDTDEDWRADALGWTPVENEPEDVPYDYGFEDKDYEDGPDDFDLRATDEAHAEMLASQWDDDPSPYHGNYSED